LLHEGLGSIAMWRDFPVRLAHATGCDAVVYSRFGHGNSDPLTAPRDVRYMHEEALKALPEFLDHLHIERPVLVGHSDGGSIALIHAGAGSRPVAAVVTLAAHVLVEDISVASIAAAKVAYATTDLREKLARYHADVDSAFLGWNRIWLDPEFRAWNIEEYLPHITCPVFAIQGEGDEYGTMKQMRRIGARVRNVELLELAACRHSPHKDQPDAVLAAIARFVARLAP
jgi:pimeloyl-ACP methyl ester carboxylesterase